jgi:hypothetical protein
MKTGVKPPQSSGENRISEARSSDITGMFWLTRVSSLKTNMLASSGKKKGRALG